MLFTPEMESLQAQMTAVIVRDAEDFFDDPKESEDLQTTVRIACEFLYFSATVQQQSRPEEADYWQRRFAPEWTGSSQWRNPAVV